MGFLFRAMLLTGAGALAYTLLTNERRQAQSLAGPVSDARLSKVERATHSMTAAEPFEDRDIEPVSATDLGLPAKPRLGDEQPSSSNPFA